MGAMACPDCGNVVSTEAVACPRCGRPVRVVQAVRVVPKTSGCTWIVAIFAALFGLLVLLGAVRSCYTPTVYSPGAKP